MVCNFQTSNSWVILNPIEQSIKQKIEAVGTPLKDWDIKINRGILTGCNDAFIIDEAKRDELIAEDPKSAEIIRPILRGRDIKRYGYNWAQLYLIATFPSRHYDIDDYPAVKRYLLSFDKERLLTAGYTDIANNSKLLREYCQKRLEQSGKDVVVDGRKIVIEGKVQKSRKKTGNKWFETQDQIGYWEDFSKPKIVWAETMRIKRDNNELFPRFSYIKDYVFTNNSCFLATGRNIKYILAFLNSVIGRYQLSQMVSILDNGGYFMREIYINLFKVPKGNPSFQESIDLLLSEITKNEITSFQRDTLEERINLLTFQAFQINSQEQEYITNVISRELDSRKF